MNLVLVLGARPQFIKAAPVCAALAAAGTAIRILHTGQHYDHEMSGAFFSELGLAPPVWNLGCGGSTHGAMTGSMLVEIEKVLINEHPDLVIVFGDTNSTLAGALAAAKLHIPVAHVEAGLRSGNRRMPEELNRICTDHLSDLLFCSSDRSRSQLASEGITKGVHVTGDVMADVFLTTLGKVRAGNTGAGVRVPDGPWALMTLHRAENTESPENIRAIFDAISESGIPVILPLHPRTRKMMERANLTPPEGIHCIAATGYAGMAALLDNCEMVLTDSGGLQKEAYWAGKPCITLRGETEWTELVSAGWNVVVGANAPAIARAMRNPPRNAARPVLYGDGQAAARVAGAIREFFKDERYAEA